MKLSAHFDLEEFLPRGVSAAACPAHVVGNLIRLCNEVLEPARAALDGPIEVTSGYRPPAFNTHVGGVATSDHHDGNAADIYAPGLESERWEDRTIALHRIIATQLDGKFGQLILEDRRKAEGRPSRLWIHVSNPTKKHPADAAANRLLASYRPGSYEPWSAA